MKIVSNTSPICYLLLIDCVHVLPTLFGKILIPEAVRVELTAEGSPKKLQEWMRYPPDWLEIIQQIDVETDLNLSRLHPGEQAAIKLAQRISADIVILDEKKARQIAQNRGLKVIGMLGIIEEVATRGMIGIVEIIDRLSKTNFRASPVLLKQILDRHRR